MDLFRYRDNAPQLRRWPGSGKLVALRALSRPQIQLAERFGQQIGQHIAPSAGYLATQLQVLSLALCQPDWPNAPLASAADLSMWLDPGDVAALFALWHQVQLESIPDLEALRHAILARMGEDDALIVDGMTASMLSLVEYHGCRPTEITEGQLGYYLVAGNCYRRLYGAQAGPQRFINRELLS